MIIRHDLELIFIHVPKCAGKELRAIFMDGAKPESSESLFNFVYSNCLHRYVDLAHLTMSDLVHFPVHQWLKDYRVVAAVRNPYERLLSSINEYYRQFSKADEIVANSNEEIPLSMRLAYLRELPLRHALIDPRFIHSLPITWFTHYGKKPMIDYLIYCESLKDDFIKIASALNLPKSMIERATCQLRNQTPTTKKQTLSDSEAMLANMLYDQDFETFGYKKLPLAWDENSIQLAHYSNPLAHTLIDLYQSQCHSHSINFIERAAEVKWHWGPNGHRDEPKRLSATREKLKND